MADTHELPSCPLMAELGDALHALLALTPLVLPSDEVLMANAKNVAGGDAPPVVVALWADLHTQGKPAYEGARSWTFDRESAPATSHFRLHKTQVMAKVDRCFARLSQAASALAPGLWAHVQSFSVLHQGGGHPTTFQLRFPNNQVVQGTQPQAFVRSVLRAFDAARGIPAGRHHYRVYPVVGSDDHRSFHANSLEDAALLGMIVERAHNRGSAPVAAPYKIVQTSDTRGRPDLLEAAARINALPFS